MATLNPFQVYMYQDDLERFDYWVHLYPNTQTGGNLFGLWTQDGNAVINVAVGPGQNCQRTKTSFKQDIAVQALGERLNRDYMIFHIGEWHSNHTLSVTGSQPSPGDWKTIRENLPHACSSFLLLIATIENHSTKLHPYFFRREIQGFSKANLSVLKSPNPYLEIQEMNALIEDREEKISVKKLDEVANKLRQSMTLLEYQSVHGDDDNDDDDDDDDDNDDDMMILDI